MAHATKRAYKVYNQGYKTLSNLENASDIWDCMDIDRRLALLNDYLWEYIPYRVVGRRWKRIRSDIVVSIYFRKTICHISIKHLAL